MTNGSPSPPDVAVAVAVEFIGPWYRFGALLWSTVIVALPAGALLAGLLGDQFLTDHGRRFASVVAMLAVTAYTLSCWILFARTPGLWLCSSRLVDFRSGARPRPWQCLVRFACMPLSAAALMIGFAWAVRQPHRRTWHDLLARTAVIGDGSLRRPTAAEQAEGRYCIEPPPWRTPASPAAASPG